MGRKILALLFVTSLAAVMWYGARWYTSQRDLDATLIFKGTLAVRRGSPVVYAGTRIGTVRRTSKMSNDQTAVEVRVDRQSRHLLRTDSSYIVQSFEGNPALAVASSIAVGPPIEDGAVVSVSSQHFAGWLAKGNAAVAKITKWYEGSRVDHQFEEWERKAPEWRRSGKEVFDKNFEAVKKQVEEAEAELRRAHRDGEAEKLRRKFKNWVDSVGSNS